MGEGKVAIIEPDQQLGRMLVQAFQAADFQVETAASAEEGLALCERFFPQVVLIDTALPDGDGFQMCQRIRATTRIRHIHIILLDQSREREARIRGLQTGADDFVTVPFDVDELTLRVRNALRRAAADNLTDPVTGLPGRQMIQVRLRELLQEEQWALLSLTIRHLKSFEEVHGFLAGQEVLRSMTRLLGEEVSRLGRPEDFIGYSGGGRFLVVTGEDRVERLVEAVQSRFLEEVKKHYTFREREQGYILVGGEGEEQRVPLMRLDIRWILASDGPFYDIRSLTEALG